MQKKAKIWKSRQARPNDLPLQDFQPEPLTPGQRYHLMHISDRGKTEEMPRLTSRCVKMRGGIWKQIG